jgi:hypothetical protein
VEDGRANVQPGLHALVGATAMLGGVFRSSISLVLQKPFFVSEGRLKHDKRTKTKNNSRALGFRVMVRKFLFHVYSELSIAYKK